MVKPGLKFVQLALARLDQQMTAEQSMPGIFGDDAHRQAMLVVGAAVKILNKDLFAGRIVHHVLKQDIEMLRRERPGIVPPDGVLGPRIADDELVLGGAAGVHARLDDKRTVAARS